MGDAPRCWKPGAHCTARRQLSQAERHPGSSADLRLLQEACLVCLFQADGLAWEQLSVVLPSYVKLEEMSLAYLVTFRDFLKFLSGFFTSWDSVSPPPPHLEHSPVLRNFPPRWNTLSWRELLYNNSAHLGKSIPPLCEVNSLRMTWMKYRLGFLRSSQEVWRIERLIHQTVLMLLNSADNVEVSSSEDMWPA